MFRMKVEMQMNMADRTLLLGIPEYNLIPKVIKTQKGTFLVFGCSVGVKPPYISLEIERTDHDLIGKNIFD